jgi:hypothetical protein
MNSYGYFPITIYDDIVIDNNNNDNNNKSMGIKKIINNKSVISPVFNS